LIGKEFTDEDTRYVILNIEFVRGENIKNYVCDVIEKRNYVNGRPTITKIHQNLLFNLHYYLRDSLIYHLVFHS
jgi:hypothetical protein